MSAILSQLAANHQRLLTYELTIPILLVSIGDPAVGNDRCRQNDNNKDHQLGVKPQKWHAKNAL
jgi:TM2 domain-containing membrane protein YozV